MSDHHAPPADCDAVTHLKWTLETDWTTITGGRPLEPGWEARTTGWRQGRDGTEAWLDSLTPVQTPSWGTLQAAHFAAGLNPRFRTEPAASGDRHYGWYDMLEPRMVRKLDVDGTNNVPPMARAIRGFLDIIHTHPFDDGNTRAACIWLAWSLVGADLNVPDLAPVLEIPKPAGDAHVPAAMAELLS